jgi:hypothetical protein
MQMENVGQRIGNLPTLCQTGLNVEMLVASQQGVEDKFVNALRLAIDPNSRIEVRRAALDNHYQRVGIVNLRAGEVRQNTSTNE